VGKGQLKERCGLESQTNIFPFKKSSKTECRLDSGADYIREYTVYKNTYKYKYKYIYIYRVIKNDCRGFNNLSYTIHLR